MVHRPKPWQHNRNVGMYTKKGIQFFVHYKMNIMLCLLVGCATNLSLTLSFQLFFCQFAALSQKNMSIASSLGITCNSCFHGMLTLMVHRNTVPVLET